MGRAAHGDRERGLSRAAPGSWKSRLATPTTLLERPGRSPPSPGHVQRRSRYLTIVSSSHTDISNDRSNEHWRRVAHNSKENNTIDDTEERSETPRGRDEGGEECEPTKPNEERNRSPDGGDKACWRSLGRTRPRERRDERGRCWPCSEPPDRRYAPTSTSFISRRRQFP